jgi:phenylpropionate dioxygenase-like ring-hydroxylating dioxygenase large terminal subunit
MNHRENSLKTRFSKELREASVPLLEASTHPPEFYTSKDFYQLEVERIFLKEWLCVARWDEVEKPGDFLTINLLGEPLIVARNEANQIQAFSAVCLHRGMEVVEGRGNQKSFQCRYHGWTYSLEGKLIGAPEMDKTKRFERSAHRLPCVKVEEWEGFIFVNFDLNAASLKTQLAPLSEYLKNYGLSQMKETKTVVYECNFNWKLMVENYMEFYHVTTLHAGPHDFMPAQLSTTDDYNGKWEISHGRITEPGSNFYSGDGSASPFPPIAALTEDQRLLGDFILVYPTHLFTVMPDSMFYYQVLPSGYDKITLRMHICFPAETMKLPTFDAAMKQAWESLLFINDADMAACASVQKGWSSRSARAGRYCWLDKVLWNFNCYVRSRVLGDQLDSTARPQNTRGLTK